MGKMDRKTEKSNVEMERSTAEQENGEKEEDEEEQKHLKNKGQKNVLYRTKAEGRMRPSMSAGAGDKNRETDRNCTGEGILIIE